MWERVQSIVNLVEDLRNTNAEAAAYHRLVQCILEGTTSEMNSLFVKVVTSSKPNRRHLPHATGHQALPNIQIDLSLEHRIPTRHTDVFAQLPYSLLLLLRRAFSSAWSIGPFSDTSLVLCMAVVRTPFSESPRAEAELQAAVGGACMIADRLEQVDLMLSMKPVLPPLSLRTISFPVITLIVIGDTWYYQIAYRSSRTCCVVLPARLAGECGTHVGTFKLLVFITALRKWCRDVYYQEYTDILQELGATVGWKRPVD
ncbi:hypothetical protein Q9L58_006658 [Maublancomyces gigas]|uniref:PD-(D/E)XK nuclease-like domain-containing protein n=1 Tax=Discina gigas TaxID=1032678 RepID=A0ABR3GER7_9PEZI